MRIIPYGYAMKDGKIVVNEKEACALKRLFENYLGGMSLKASAKSAGIPCTHNVICHMLENPLYAGDNTYPALINQEMITQARKIRLERAKKLGRDKMPHKRRPRFYAKTQFYLDEIDNAERSALEQAEYIYEQIQEVKNE